MNRYKKLLCVLLATVCALQMTTPVFANEVLPEDTLATDTIIQNELQVIDNSYYGITDETVFAHTATPVVDAADVPCAPMPEASRANTTGSSPSNPYTTLNIPDEDLNVVIQAIKNSAQIVAVNYDGVYCYKFTYGGKSVYVRCDTFTKTRSAGISTTTSVGVTDNLNNHNTDYTYTTMMKSYYYTWNGMDVYRWSFVRMGVRAHRAQNNSIVYFTTEVMDAYDFDAYVYSVQDRVPCSLKVTPTMTLSMTNSSNGAYFDSYEYEGTGENISGNTIDIASMVNIGYSTAKIVGSVATTGLTPGNLFSAYNLVVNLIKTTSGSRKSYDSINYPLSGSNKYTYKFSVATPFAIRYAGDNAQMGMGVTGDSGGTARFSAALTWAAS